MKKRLIFIIIMLLLNVLMITPAAQASTLLKTGNSGSSVQALQTDLKTLGFFSGSIDGIYGVKTKEAVIAFQQNNHLQADGICGSATLKSISRALKTKQILSTAYKYSGTPYVWGGTSPSGFDCSGFTQYVFAKNGVSLPRVSRDQYNKGTSVAFNALRPGDLIFFNLSSGGKISHVAIYIGNNQFIGATSSKGVRVLSLTSYWKNAYVGAKRIY
ncbi:C40 family peptidase [Desulfitobacterium sp.]|uniref:C40 family peptidase n=1 Tax=Desulfitobacterium sp. TaxID=49981 RepID=UPI002B209753|nr:NlpC/P60 family protein [Desulfitobacterium sp.]MEA4901951.1 NlpC/P60 family protein [Desulfitobacterium sp.]